MSAPSHRAGALPLRAVAVAPAVALVTLLAALVATAVAGTPLRDPGQVAATRLTWVVVLVVLLLPVDVVVRAVRRAPGHRPSAALLWRVRQERWPVGQLAALVVLALSFYVTYLAYRNLKSVVPIVRPGHLYDHGLSAVDRALFAGHDPATVLHAVLGTGLAVPVLSYVYMLFFPFVPVALALILILAPTPRARLLVATAFVLTWAIGAGGYYLLPSIGPFHADPADFAGLSVSRVTHLQQGLMNRRMTFLFEPSGHRGAQSVGAFPSLHVAIVALVAMATHVFGLARPWKLVAWTLVALTTLSTVYFGWHFVLDDVAGLIIAGGSLLLARWAIGPYPHAAPARRPAREPKPAPGPTAAPEPTPDPDPTPELA